MDSRPALLTVIISIAVITIVAFLSVDMTERLDKQQREGRPEYASIPLDPDPAVSQETPGKPTEGSPQEETPSFKVKPVEDEPDLPMTVDEAKKLGCLALPRGGYCFKLKHPKLGEEIEGVAVPGMILMSRGLIEFYGTAEGSGKDHESIVRLNCDIQELDMGLQIARLKRGPVPERLGDPKVKQGDRVLVFLRWKEGDKVVTHRAEDLVVDVKRTETMARVGWTYVGGWVPVDNPVNPDKESRILAASMSRLLMSTWRNLTTLLDNPLPDALDPDTYFANYDVLPAPGKEVLVYFRAPTMKEREEITRIERKHAK